MNCERDRHGEKTSNNFVVFLGASQSTGRDCFERCWPSLYGDTLAQNAVPLALKGNAAQRTLRPTSTCARTDAREKKKPADPIHTCDSHDKESACGATDVYGFRKSGPSRAAVAREKVLGAGSAVKLQAQGCSPPFG